MKKIVILLSFLLLLPASAFAGRYTLGVDAWIVFWDSAIGGVVNESIDAYIDDEIDNYSDTNISGYSVSHSKKPGSGLMMGPSFTWETDDRTWAVSAGGMFSTIIAQKMSFPGYVTYTAVPFIGTANLPLSIKSDVKLTRMEVQAEGRYRFLKYFTVFAGYQYMFYKIDAKFTGGVSTLGVNLAMVNKEATVTSNIHFPLAGIGFEYPVLSWLTLGFDIASGYMFADAEANLDGDKGDIDIDPKMGMMAALKGAWKVSKSIDITFGYRFQYLAFDMTTDLDLNLDLSTPDKSSQKETFHGLTFGCRYKF